MQKAIHRRAYALLVFSLIFLVNPNVSVIDPLPDFIACYIISKLLLRAADTSPYFDEARTAFIRLGWLNLAKIGGLIVITVARGANTSDYDIVALCSLVFSAGEILLSVSAIKYLFKALYYLGERADKPSLIAPFTVLGKRKSDPDVLLNLSYLFAVVKCVCYTLPYLFLLTTDPDSAAPSPARFYPTVLTATFILTLVIGIVWLISALRYASLTVGSGDLDQALEAMMSDETRHNFENKQASRRLSSVATLFAIASLFSLEIVFEDYRSIDLVPSLLIGIFLIALAARLGSSKEAARLKIASLVFTVAAFISYVFEIRFLRQFEYYDLLSSKDALASYLYVEIFGAIEFVTLAAMLFLLAIALRAFIYENTGIEPSSEKYRESDREYHKSLLRRTYAMIGLGFLSGAARFASIFINSEVQLLGLNPNDFSQEAIPAPSIPWFGLLTFIITVAYIAYSFYHASYLKDEIKAKRGI